MARKIKYVEDKDFNILLPFKIKDMGMPSVSAGVPDGEAPPEVITIEGYASYSGDISVSESCCYIDRANDVVVPAGMDLTNYKKNPVILMNHDRDYPIGKAVDVQKRPDGIFVTAEVHAGAMDEEDFYAIKNGIVNSFSIGFRTKAGEFRTVNDLDVYFMVKTELFEISCVTIPCNTESGFSVIKSFGDNGFGAIDIKPTPSVVDVNTKLYGDEIMKLKLKELLTNEQIEHFKSVGLEADLEELKEVSTKSYIDSLFAKLSDTIKSDVLAVVEEKLSAKGAVETTVATETGEADPTSTQEEGKSEEGEVETKEDENAEAVKAMAGFVDQLKALAV